MSPDIDGFTDLVEVGRGGFGTVYRARQQDSGRSVAVKVLPDVRGTSEAYGRFAREFAALSAVGAHPNIATVHGCGLTRDGSGYLALDLLTGGSLADRVGSGPCDWGDVASWGVQLSGALETAHRAGVTHRDIKPENVLFDSLGTPQFVDFGIAGVPGAFRTATGAVTLTLAHAAPEVVAGGRGGVPGDVYSLASTLFAALAGAAAFAAEADETLVPMLARIATAPVPDLRPRGVPDSVCTAVERGMAKDPAERPASAEALGMALQAAMSREGRVCAAPVLLLSPGVAATFAVAAPVAGIGALSAPPGPGEVAYDGARTLTGWVAPAVVPPPETTLPGVVPTRRRARRAWLITAGVAAAAVGILALRGVGDPTPAAAGPDPTATSGGASHPSVSRTATPSTTPRPSSSPSVVATSGSVALVGASARRTSTTPRSSSSPSADPSTTPSTPTPPPPTPPAAPRTVRVGGAVVVRTVAGSAGLVSLRVSWLPSVDATAVTTYDVRWVVVGGPGSGTGTMVTTIGSTGGSVQVPQPASGTWYRWQVRATAGPTSSRWVTAHVTVPRVVGRRVGPAKSALRAIGIRASTYTRTTTTASSVGRVLAQSIPAGRVVLADSPIALGVGKAP